MNGPRIGALFAGYGGLELGTAEALGGHPAWFSEIDEAPSKILNHHWPHVPNLGDVTAIDWTTAPPVDVLAGGFPCQDVSLAGLRRGLHPDTRSGLWSHFAAAIDALRPPLVIVENVRGLLSAEAHSDLEPDPWDLGEPDGSGRPTLRALGAVLGDLADLGYDAEWTGLRAADAGAPHGRFRVFVIAHPRGAAPRNPEELRRLEESPRPTGTRPLPPRGPDRAPQNPEREPRDQRRQPTPRPLETGRTRPDPRRRDRTSAPDAGRLRAERGPRIEEQTEGRTSPPDRHRSTTSWGAYEPAVRRWEHITRRTAPNPTTPGPTGGQRLSPVFVEWMMGLPEGHVTDPAIGLTRNEQLKALGNGVVPQQAALALQRLTA